MSKKLILMSRCLLGECVRYDGGHKHQFEIVDFFKKYFDFYPICPEVECGLSIPREPMEFKNAKLRTLNTQLDLTEQMDKFFQEKITQLKKIKIYAFIGKSKSPSCSISPRGIFTIKLLESLKNLPISDELSLTSEDQRSEFLSKTLSYEQISPP